MIFKTRVFITEALLFVLTLVLSIIVARYRLGIAEYGQLASSQDFSLSNYLFFFIVVVIFYFISTRFKKVASWTFRFFLIFTVFMGASIVSGSLFPMPYDIVLAVIFTIVFLFARNVLVHDLGVAIGLAGVAAVLGMSLTPRTTLILIIVLAVYDILAVYWTRHMVVMANTMIESGAVFGFIVPSNPKDLFMSSHKARKGIGNDFMVLGSGDIGLPAIVLSSIAAISLNQALITGLFSLAGLFLTHLIFMNQKARKPMAALPPIATLTVIGYLISLL